jgi:hypothetical protein
MLSQFADDLQREYAATASITAELVAITGIEIPELYAAARKLGDCLLLNERLLILREFYLRQGRLPEFIQGD